MVGSCPIRKQLHPFKARSNGAEQGLVKRPAVAKLFGPRTLT